MREFPPIKLNYLYVEKFINMRFKGESLSAMKGMVIKMNKKIALTTLVFIFVLFLSGCGGSNTSRTAVIQDDVLAYISNQEDNSVGDLYLIGGNEERKKISSNM